MSSKARSFELNFVGDVMLGRLVDQFLPTHVREPEEARIVASILSGRPHLNDYTAASPWGNTLPLFQNAHLNFINLETAVTTHDVKWPDKVFNYRMHPANIEALKAANIHYASLANNHTLDFSEPGLLETVQTLKQAGIQFAGAGETEEEARIPAVLKLPGTEYTIAVVSASDHPGDWSRVPNFHLINYSSATRERLKSLFAAPLADGSSPSLRVFSVHWGPNYSWHPEEKIRSLAHYLIDECGVDIIHGHSSHHVQGVEKYKNGSIIYGCGDFVDDYAINKGYRNDLSAIWRVTVGPDRENQGILKVKRLEIIPTKIESFQVNIVPKDEKDFDFVRDRIASLSGDFNTRVDVLSDRLRIECEG